MCPFRSDAERTGGRASIGLRYERSAKESKVEDAAYLCEMRAGASA